MKTPAKKRDKAVALRYNAERENAPRIAAKGEGHLAEKIREIANQYDIPIFRDDDLTELLSEIDIDREIPCTLYAAVAEILSWIYRAEREMEGEMQQ